MQGVPKEYPSEIRGPAARIGLGRLDDYPWVWASCHAFASRLSAGMETLPNWIVQARTDRGVRTGLASTELEANEILKAAMETASPSPHASIVWPTSFQKPGWPR